METSKNKIKNVIMFIVIFITVASYILPRELGNLDEIWIYNSAKNIADGLIPYKDFNLVTTPFLPLLAGAIIAMSANELIVMRILAVLLASAIIFTIEKILEKMNVHRLVIYITLLGIAILLRNQFCIDYNFINLFLILCLILLEMKKSEKNNNKIKHNFFYDFLIGLLAGMTIGFKQTTGLIILLVTLFSNILIIRTKEEWKQYAKMLGIRMLGAIIPLGILQIYFLIYQLWPFFIDYCILGIKEFTNTISYKELWENSTIVIKTLLVTIPIILIYMYFTTIVKRKTQEQQEKLFYVFCYSIASCSVIFPITDEIHFLIGIVPAIIGMVYVLDCVVKWLEGKIKKEKIKVFLKNFIKCGLIISIIVFSLKNIRELINYIQVIKNQKTFSHYSYIPISDGLYARIYRVDEYIVKQQNKVHILDASAAIFKIPLDKYDKYYDLFLKGNLGSKGMDKLITDIQQSEGVKLLIQEPPRNWQTPEQVIEFVEQNKEKIEKIDLFLVYQ